MLEIRENLGQYQSGDQDLGEMEENMGQCESQEHVFKKKKRRQALNNRKEVRF
jgi:hypothetical protein